MGHCKILKYSFILFIVFNISAVDIGSDSAVTRFSTQQIINNGDRIAGFAALEAGFKLNGSGVVGTFDSFFEVSGINEFWLGELVLNRDLIFRGVSTITHLGDITGHHHAMEFSSSMTILPDNLTGSHSYVFSEVAKTESQTADVESVDWAYSDTFIAIGLDETSSGDDLLKIFHILDGEFVLNDSIIFATKRTINSVRWHPSAYFLAMCRENSGAGDDELIIYEADSSTGVLTKKSGIDFGNNVTAIAWHPTGDWLAVCETNVNNEVAVYSVSATGVINAIPVAIYDIAKSRYASTEAVSWDSTGDYLTIGTNATASKPEFMVFYFNQVTPSLTLNVEKYISKTVLCVDFNSTYTDIIAISISALSGDIVEIYQHNATAGTLTKKIGISDFDKPTNVVSWNPNGNLLAIGIQPIVGGEFRIYSYDNDSFTVSSVIAFEKDGGVIAIRWSHDGLYVAVGDDGTYATIYGTIVANTACVTFTDLDIILNNDLYLRQNCVHFSGESVILGRGNVLTMSPSCTIILDSGASLQLKDITICGVKQNNIYCVDDSCTVSLEDATYILDQDYSFTIGKLAILGDFKITGEGKTFAYQTDQISTVSCTGRIIVDNAVTFSYDPPIASKELINFISYNSEIFLDGGTLHATSTGMKFSTGRMVVGRRSALSTEGTVDSEAISFEDDFAIQWLPAANLDLFGGNIVFDTSC